MTPAQLIVTWFSYGAAAGAFAVGLVLALVLGWKIIDFFLEM